MKTKSTLFTLALLLSGAAQAGLTSIAQVPLLNIKGTGAVKPNLMLVYDNSGSMAFEFTPDVIAYNPVVATNGVCRSAALLSTSQKTCEAGDPPFSSPDLNKQYYNPDIRYLPPVGADGVPYNVANYGNVSPWDKVRNDGFDGGTSTTNLVSGFKDLKWCDSSSICYTNAATYFYPNDVNKTANSVTGAPYYYRIDVAEYCTDATLTSCTTTLVGAGAPVGFPVPAPVRWCTTTALATATCQAKVDKTHMYPRFSNPSGNVVIGYGSITIAASATTSPMSVNSVTVQEGGLAVSILNAAVAAPTGTNGTAPRAALANDIAASIIAKTGLSNQYTACVKTPSSGSSVPDCDQLGITLVSDYVVAIIPLDCPSAGIAKASCTPLGDNSRSGWAVSATSTVIPPTALITVSGTSTSVAKIASAQLGATELFGSPLTALTFTSGNKTSTQVAAGIQGKIATVGTITAYVGGNSITPVCKAASSSVVCLVDTANAANGTKPALGAMTNPGTTKFVFSNGAGADTIKLTSTPLSAGNAIFVRTNIVKSRDNYPKDPDRTDCAAATSCTYIEEMTNFATWYTFYRTRNQMMKTAVGQAFAGVTSSYRVGLATLREVAASGTIAMVPTTFSGTDRASWYTKLYGVTASGGTPLRSAVHKVGLMFATNPDVVTELCQPNFMLVTTDGYWNGGTTTAVTDNDSKEDASHFCTKAGGCVDADSPNTNSNSLADIALYWYNGGSNGTPKSLITGRTGLTAALTEDMSLEGAVPGRDGENKHLHITTYTLGLGVDGIMNYDPNYDKANVIGDFSKLLSGATGCPWNAGGKYIWPNVHSEDPNTDYQSRVDDLWHAAVSGRGKYFTASVPADVVKGLTSALNNMKSVSGAASAAATSTPNISLNDNDIFSDTYTTVKWFGELSAQKIDINDGTVGDASTWTTSATIGTKVSATADTRKIYMFDATAADKLTPFLYDNVPEKAAWFDNRCGVLAQCTTLTDAEKVLANSGANVVNWLRGQQQYADDNIFRAYSSYKASPTSAAIPIVLGDIASSKPAFVRDPRKAYTITGYADFKSKHTPPAATARKPMVYTAANDGMLHAFDAATGEEQWAYAPRITMKKLAAQASTNYSSNHQFTTDGSPEVGDVQIGGVWKTVLVAGLGGGGRGYYALDVTDPLKPVALWELCADSAVCAANHRADIGLTYGNPQFGMWNDKWVVYLTSGYNNVDGVDGVAGGDGNGHLFIVDVATGAIEKDAVTVGDTGTPSGLARITAISANPQTDPVTTYIYGGDNQGQMWRFDLTGAKGSNPVVSMMGDAGVKQPITTRPEVSTCEVNTEDIVSHHITTTVSRVVLFGTGRLLDTTDSSNADVQSMYLLKDKAPSLPLVKTTPTIAVRGTTMIQQNLKVLDATHKNTYLVSSKAVDLSTADGWFIDWDLNPRERLNLDPKIVNGGINVVTNVTGESSACSVGGSSNVYQVGLCTGSMPSPTMIAGTTLSSGSAAVGFIIVRLPSGKLKMIATLATGDKLTGEVKPFATMGARKVGWRRVQN